jgi:hypothetical protein
MLSVYSIDGLLSMEKQAAERANAYVNQHSSSISLWSLDKWAGIWDNPHSMRAGRVSWKVVPSLNISRIWMIRGKTISGTT